MEQLTAIFMSILTFFSQLFGMGAADGYTKLTGVSQAVNALNTKNSVISTRYEGEVSTDKWSENDVFSLDDTVVLKKQKDKDFVILNITDVHFADYDERAFMAFGAIATIRRLVANTNPDLITVSGDIVCSESTVYSIKRFTDLMESFGIPWAPVFGNHEGEGNCDLNYLADIMLKSPHCLLIKGDSDMGVGNYVINIAEENTDGTLNIVESFIMMDTHKSHINEKQVQWLSWAANGINELTNSKSEISVLFHIPLVEYQYAYDAARDTENNCWRDGFDAYGELNEKICCDRDSDGNPIQNGAFAAMKNAGTVKYVFCGHEHINNFSIMYEGIRLTYTMKVGQGSGFKFGIDGGTKITIDSNGINNICHKTASYGVIMDIVNIDTTK